MIVTGDYGNWIFCREFHPSPEGSVSEQYWCEKLRMSSTQQASDFDSEATAERIKEMINGGLVEYGYEGKKLESMKEYLENCLSCVDDEREYINAAYQEIPSFLDFESVVFVTSLKFWLKAVFDGFDIICARLKVNEKEYTPMEQYLIKNNLD